MPDHEGRVTNPDLNATDVVNDDGSEPQGWGAKLAAKLDLQLGHLSDTADAAGSAVAELRKLRADARHMPALVTISSVFTWKTGVTTICQQGGNGAGVLIGGPNTGEQWHVRGIMVGGTTLIATPAGVAWFLIAPATPTDQSFTSVTDFTKQALPTNAYYGIGEFYLPPNTNLYMVVTGGGDGTQYVASVSIQASPFVPTRDEVSN